MIVFEDNKRCGYEIKNEDSYKKEIKNSQEDYWSY